MSSPLGYSERRRKADFIGGSRARTLPKTLTQEEADALLRMPNLAAPTGMRDRCVLELMLRCGLRVSETCGLYLRDVDWTAGEIRLRPEITKGQREAVVYLDAPTQALLERWKVVRRPYGAGKPHLFVSIMPSETWGRRSRRFLASRALAWARAQQRTAA